MKKNIANHGEEVKELFCKPGDERALFKYSLKNVDNFYSICSKITVDDFLYQPHRVLFLIMKSFADKGSIKSFDVPMIIHEAQNSGVHSTIGGYTYIQSINEMSLSEDNLDVYLSNVLEASTKYRLYNTLMHGLKNIEKNAKDGKESADLIGYIENNILDLSTQSKAIAEPINIADGLREYIESKKLNKVSMVGLSTGYPILDRQIDGLIPGTLLIVSARKKMGKSALLTNISTHCAFKESVPLLYVDTEMTFNEWRDRVISQMSGLEERIIKHGGYTEEEYNKINKCIKIIENKKLFHEYMPGYNLDKLVALYKKYKIKHNIGLGVFDYLKEPDSSSLDRQRKEYQILGDVTTKLKDLAGELNIPFLTAVQINRSGDIADSDRVARFGDVVAQWMEKSNEEIEGGGHMGGTHKLVIRDSRRGGSTPETGISYFFFKKRLTIREVDITDQLTSFGEQTVDYGSSDDDELR